MSVRRQSAITSPHTDQTQPPPARSQQFLAVSHILYALCEEPEIGVLELARKVGISVGTAQRITAALAGTGLLAWSPYTRKYSLGDGVLRRVNVQRAFVGAAGFTIEEGLTDAQEEEAQIKRAMVAAAREVYAVVDHTKWGRVASATFCRIDRLRAVITDDGAPPDMLARLRGLGVEVHIAGEAASPVASPVASPATAAESGRE